jgi:hypothetical protein
MDAAVVGFVLIALIVGAALGWLWASREAAGARQTVENLRLQLDEVVKERDANRGAVSELAALKAGQEEREKSFQQQIEAFRPSFMRLRTSSSAKRARPSSTRRGRNSLRRSRRSRPCSRPIRKSSRRSRRSASTIMPGFGKPWSW